MIDHHGTGTVYADHYIDANASATGEILFDVAKELMAMGAITHILWRTNLLVHQNIFWVVYWKCFSNSHSLWNIHYIAGYTFYRIVLTCF